MFEKPSLADLREAAQQIGMHPSDDYLRAVEEIVAPLASAYAALDQVADELPPVRYPRSEVRWPSPEENRHGAWYVKSSIKGRAGGPLAGRRVALKDNICLAGAPMMIGTELLRGYVPEIDATVVERVLDAGGVLGKNKSGSDFNEYQLPTGEFIYPELLVPGNPPPPFNFIDFQYLTNGSGPLPLLGSVFDSTQIQLGLAPLPFYPNQNTPQLNPFPYDIVPPEPIG